MLGLLLLWSGTAAAKSGLNIFAYPREAPQTPIYTADGKAIKLGDFKGKFLLVMFWSRYCAPCIRELDEINTFVNKTKDNGIEVLLVSQDDEWTMPGEQKELLKKYRNCFAKNPTGRKFPVKYTHCHEKYTVANAERPLPEG